MAEYIDRREVVEAICFNCSEINICVGVCDDTDRIINIPAADVRPMVRGKWLMDRDPGEPWKYTWKYKCDQCGEVTNNTCMGKPRYNYCPMCGADMRGDDAE